LAPDVEGRGDAEQDEGGGGEVEDEVGDEAGEDVVVAFVGCGFGAVGGEEEGADEAAGV
jgi:hypothetical protein